MKTLEIVLPLQVGRSPGWYWDQNQGRPIYWDGKLWYEYSAGVLRATTVWEPSPNDPIVVTVGDTVKITADFYYQGPAITSGYTLYGAIGTNVLGIFNEKLAGQSTLTLPQCTSPTRFIDRFLTIPVTAALGAGATYAIYIKVMSDSSDVAISSAWENCITVQGVTPTFSNFTIGSYSKV